MNVWSAFFVLTRSLSPGTGFQGISQALAPRQFYRKPEVSPRDQSFHYHGNAETYMLVGEAMGKAMLEITR